ncbi:hypothetical protein CEXT_583391, partial [Caerostris extrusa]
SYCNALLSRKNNLASLEVNAGASEISEVFLKSAMAPFLPNTLHEHVRGPEMSAVMRAYKGHPQSTDTLLCFGRTSGEYPSILF